MSEQPFVERIADLIEPSLWDGSERSDAVYLAKAVLEAIRTPTDAMVRAGDAWRAHCSDTESLFEEMMSVAIHGPNC